MKKVRVPLEFRDSRGSHYTSITFEL
jgi:hypothetical protein